MGFADQRTGAHTNTIESTRRHVKAYLSPYNRKVDYIYHLTHYMFAAKCRVEKLHPFTKIPAPRRHNGLEPMSPTPSVSCAEWHIPGQRTCSTASPITGTCARQREAIRGGGNSCVFSAKTKNHGFTLGTDDLLRRLPYLATRLE